MITLRFSEFFLNNETGQKVKKNIESSTRYMYLITTHAFYIFTIKFPYALLVHVSKTVKVI